MAIERSASGDRDVLVGRGMAGRGNNPPGPSLAAVARNDIVCGLPVAAKGPRRVSAALAELFVFIFAVSSFLPGTELGGWGYSGLQCFSVL